MGAGDDKRSVWFVLGALMTCLLLAALDQTIVSTALPTIVGELGGLDQISWVVTAYVLSSTVSVPLFGKISDIYGRKRMLQITIVIFLVGSVLCGLSQNMLMLILFRGIQGIGGGGMMSMTFTILADLLSPRERSKYTGYFTAVFASASIIGPLVGGFFVDHLSWRWVFYVNLPLGAVCLMVVASFLNVPVPTERRALDLIGAALLTVAVTTLLLTTTWGGNEYAWSSPLIIGLAVTGVTAAVVYFFHARRTPEAVLPLRMFREPVFRTCTILGALLGGVMVGAATFLPLFLQVVKGVSATSSGFLLVPMMGGVVLGSNVTGRIVNYTGRYKVFPILGIGLTVVGMVLLSLIDEATSRTYVSVSMALIGLGIGSSMPILTIAVQNTASKDDMGAATSSVNFFRSLGSAFGVALFGTVMSSRLTSTVDRLLPGAHLTDQEGVLSSPTAIRGLPLEQYQAVAHGITEGVTTVFVVALPIVIAAFVLSLFLKEVPLQDDLEFGSSFVEGMEEAGMMFQPNVEPLPTFPEPIEGHEGHGPGAHRRHGKAADDVAEDVRPHL